MKCHYEILGIARDADEDSIKKAYRKLALQWHPDKNLDRAEEAHERFQTIQQAYDVLSDPQERAWYDKHREAILKGGLEDYKDERLDVYQYFNSSCYSGYGDGEKGFYTVYRRVFEQIASEDMAFMDDRSSSESEIPGFGRSDSDYDSVVHLFYAYWQSYCTAKSYVWVEKYDIREADNRRILRAMEKENKKLRDKAKKERNEEVRQLVAYVRKRDKRVQEQRKRLEERAEEIHRYTEVQKKKQREERRKQRENYFEQTWATTSEDTLKGVEADLDQQFGAEKDLANDESDEEMIDTLFCVACNKAFMSEKAFVNHEKSKKHRENVDRIREEVGYEEEEEDDSDVDDQSLSDSHSVSDRDDHDVSVNNSESILNYANVLDGQAAYSEDIADLDGCTNVTTGENPATAAANDVVPDAEPNRISSADGNRVEKGTVASDSYTDDESINLSSAFVRTKLSKKRGEDFNNSTDQLDTAPELAETEGTEPCKHESAESGDVLQQRITADLEHMSVEEPEQATVSSLPNQPAIKLKGKKAKDARKAARASAGTDSVKQTNPSCNQTQATDASSRTCDKCAQTFPSRTRLFEHLKTSGHATIKKTSDANAAATWAPESKDL